MPVRITESMGSSRAPRSTMPEDWTRRTSRRKRCDRHVRCYDQQLTQDRCPWKRHSHPRSGTTEVGPLCLLPPHGAEVDHGEMQDLHVCRTHR